MDHSIGKKELDHDCEARYANHFYVGYNAFEVIVDFGQQYCGLHQVEADCPHIHTRVVTAPAFARELEELLHNALDDYERKFAPIARRGDDERLHGN